MKYIELVPGIKSSAVGFGCSSILGAVDRRTAERALGIAYEEGITHFDVARSYGYGQAEGVLGDFIKGRRDEVVVATKFGIEATLGAALLSPLKPLVRLLKGGRKPKQSTGGAGSGPKRDIAANFHRRIPITGDSMRASVHTSLKKLRTDHLDYVFLHEPVERVAELDDVAEAANELKKQGKIRAWGIAFMYTQRPFHESYLHSFDVLQFDNSPGGAHYEKVLKERSSSANIFFSPFNSSSASPGNGVSFSREEYLRQMLADFPKSVVLCSMFSEKHIRQNARAAGD